MRIKNIQTISDLMFYCHMPDLKHPIQEMKTGSILFLGQYKINNLIVEAWLSKLEKQLYSFNGTYANLTNKRLVFSWDNFELRENRLKFDLGNTKKIKKIKTFALICRYIAIVINNAPYEQKNIFFEMGLPPFFNGVLINKKCITHEQFFNQEFQKFVNYDCRDHLPIPPIEIIVDTAINEGLINLSNSASAL